MLYIIVHAIGFFKIPRGCHRTVTDAACKVVGGPRNCVLWCLPVFCLLPASLFHIGVPFVLERFPDLQRLLIYGTERCLCRLRGKKTLHRKRRDVGVDSCHNHPDKHGQDERRGRFLRPDRKQ